MLPAPFGSRQVAETWKWRDREGRLRPPRKMRTTHLFHTFRMIWNNFMPTEWRVGAVKLYAFPPFYTKAYFADAVVFIGRELAQRKDLTPQQRAQLDEMAAHFIHHPELLNGPEPPSDGRCRSCGADR